MSYLGNTPTSQNFLSGTDYFTGNASTTAFTLSRAVSSTNDILVIVGTTVQPPSAYTVSGTTLTFTSAPASGTNNICVRYLSTTTFTVDVSDQSVNTAKVQDGAITSVKLASGAAVSNIGFTPYNATNPNGYLSSVSASVLTGSTLATGVTSSSLTSVGTLSSIRVNGLSNLGTNTFTKSSFGNGDLALDNGSTDTPGILFYYANNKNWGIDSYYDTGASKQVLRFVSDLNESGGATRASLDNTGKFTATSFAGDGSKLTNVLQVVQAVKTDTWTGTASYNTYTAITGLSVSITPKSSLSKFLIMTTINYDNNRGNSGGGFVIFRNGSMLTGAAGVPGSNQYSVFGDFGANANADQSGMSRSFQVIDSPATTAALTYDIRITQDGTSYTTYVNRARADALQNDDGRFASSLIVLEIAG